MFDVLTSIVHRYDKAGQILNNAGFLCMQDCPSKAKTGYSIEGANDYTPPPTSKPSSGRTPADYWIPWAELLRKTVSEDPEICACGARMLIDDAMVIGNTITEILKRMGISIVVPKKLGPTGELDYVYDV